MSEELVELVRDYIYDCTTDGFGHGWTLSREQTEYLIALARRGMLSSVAATPTDIIDEAIAASQGPTDNERGE